VAQRCQFSFEGKDGITGRPQEISGAVVGAQIDGILVDVDGQRYWASPNAGEHAGARHFIPGSGSLRVQGRMALQEVKLAAEGRTVAAVAGQVWESMMDAPGPETYAPQFDWKSDDAKFDGAITLDGKLDPKALPRDKSIVWDGERLVLDHATVRAVLNLRLQTKIRKAQLTATLPAVVPAPKQMPNPFEEGFLDS
jgi:hypothetical protein